MSCLFILLRYFTCDLSTPFLKFDFPFGALFCHFFPFGALFIEFRIAFRYFGETTSLFKQLIKKEH